MDKDEASRGQRSAGKMGKNRDISPIFPIFVGIEVDVLYSGDDDGAYMSRRQSGMRRSAEKNGKKWNTYVRDDFVNQAANTIHCAITA